MAKRKRSDDVDAILEQTAKQERRLLKRERRAEADVVKLQEELATARARLAKAQDRVEIRQKALAQAERRLQDQRAARAGGPQPVAVDATSPDGTVTPNAQADPVVAEPPATEPATEPQPAEAADGQVKPKPRPKKKAPAPKPASPKNP